MMTATAQISTPNAARYLTQLCKHFAHKVSVAQESTTGVAHFPDGTGRFCAEEGMLQIACEAETAEGLAKVQYIIEDHLTRFGWKEKLTVPWKT